MNDAPLPTWQCVMICWGEKYDVEYINHTVEAVLRECPSEPRFVLISDRPRPGLNSKVMLVDFDRYFLRSEFMSGGCQAKLVMFQTGVLPDDLPAIYLDLDTAVLGDISQALRLMKTRKSVLMIQSVVLPFGWPGRLVYRLSGGKRYARGNSSVVVFHPAECTYIADRWRTLWDEHGRAAIKPMKADERFISWTAQMHVNRLPNWLVVKFLNEYMHSAKWLVYLKGAIPAIQRRRSKLAVVTLPGELIKPENIVTFQDGEEHLEQKGRWLLWNSRALGDIGVRLQEYYRPLFEKLAEKKSL